MLEVVTGGRCIGDGNEPEGASRDGAWTGWASSGPEAVGVTDYGAAQGWGRTDVVGRAGIRTIPGPYSCLVADLPDEVANPPTSGDWRILAPRTAVVSCHGQGAQRTHRACSAGSHLTFRRRTA